MKRILESSDSSSSNSGGEEEKEKTPTKVAKTDNPTGVFISLISFFSTEIKKSRGKQPRWLPRWTILLIFDFLILL